MSSVHLEELHGTTWVDTDGKKYERRLDDGDLVDTHIGFECPCCSEEFQHRDFFLEHLQQYHRPAEVYVAVVE